MSREIKFRAWVKKTKTMVDLYQTTPLALDANLQQDGIFIPFSEEFIIMQFSGLKDKNDNEIYEGDVIKTSWEGNKEVVFRKGCFCYQTGGDKYHIFNEKKVEVIGNIYENKDLLKAELSEGELI